MASKVTRLVPIARSSQHPFVLSTRSSGFKNVTPSSTRRFHASPRRQFLDPVLLGTHAALEAVHSISGTPWVVTLPLSALLLRLTILLPFTIYQRKLLQRQISLTPLISGWSHVIKKQTFKEAGHLGPVKATATLQKNLRAKQKEILKRWGCQRWKSTVIPLAQIPVWLVMTETIRRMCGISQGLLGIFISRLEQLGLWSSQLVHSQVAGLESSLDSLSEAASQSLGVESSFATEGALWVPDLLAADPQLVLPFMLSGAILLNIFGKTAAKEGPRSKWQLRIQRGLGLVGLAAAPMAMQIPSAMLVYWITSASLGYLQALVLDRVSPLPTRVAELKPKAPLMTQAGIPNTSTPESVEKKS